MKSRNAEARIQENLTRLDSVAGRLDAILLIAEISLYLSRASPESKEKYSGVLAIYKKELDLTDKRSEREIQRARRYIQRAHWRA